MMKLKLQYFGRLMRRGNNWKSWERLGKMLGKSEGRRRRRCQQTRRLDGITNTVDWVWASSGSWWWTGNPGMLQSLGSPGSETTNELNDKSLKKEYLFYKLSHGFHTWLSHTSNMSYPPSSLKYSQYIQFNEFGHMSTLLLSSLQIKQGNKYTHHHKKFPCVPLFFVINLFQWGKNI